MSDLEQIRNQVGTAAICGVGMLCLQACFTELTRCGAALLPQAKELLEFYFGNSNLLKDRFMRHKIETTEGGWISFELLATFKKLRNMTNGAVPPPG